MKKEEIQNLKDKAFQARSEKEWNDVMQAIKAAIAAMYDAIRVYYSNLCVIQAAEHPELNLNINNNTN